jgi:hypothetical protein
MRGVVTLAMCLKTGLHKRCGSGIFAERCNLSRKFRILSNPHRQLQREVLTAFSPV